MKAVSHKISFISNNAFEIRKDELPHFHNSWHFHDEIELTLILKSTGRRFIGDHIDQFTAGDLVLIGSKLPHLWQNEEIYYKGGADLKAEAIIIHFSKSFWEGDFLELEEVKNIKALLKKSKYGIKIGAATKESVSKKIVKLLHIEGFKRLVLFFEILNEMATDSEGEILASTGFVSSFMQDEDERLDKIYEYIMEHLTDKIELREAAKLLNLSNSAFCRFFKSKTRRTFSFFVNQARIGYACKLLQNSELSVSQICYECGFESYTYFSRTFKKLVEDTPKAYRKNYNFRKT